MSDTIIAKQCSTCKRIKPTSEFHKDRFRKDGYHNDCKNCRKHYSQSEKGRESGRRIAHKYRQTEKGKNVHREGAKRYRLRHPQKIKLYQKQYRQTEKGKIAKQRGNKLFQLRYPNRVKAQNAVNRAVMAGQMPSVNTFKCSCGKQAEQYHHYLGYEPEHWFDVLAVCIPCHIRCHR